MVKNQDLFLGFFFFRFVLLSGFSLRDRSIYDIAGLFFAFFFLGCFWPISVGTATFVECDDERERESL